MKIDSIRADGAAISARITGLPGESAVQELWFRFPAALAEGMEASAEPFVAAMLPLVMRTGDPLRVEGATLSPRFVSGCVQVMEIWRRWDSRLRPLRIVAETRPDTNSAGRRTAMFFTGGVDSWYTLLDNIEFETGHEPITDLLYIRGYSDLPIENEGACRRVEATLRSAAAALGKTLWIAETNLHEITKPDAPVGWDIHAGVKLSAAGLALRHAFRRFYVPAGETYASSLRTGWGSHPSTDPLWSTESMEFRHHGCEASRSQKLEWRVAKSAAAMDHLWVCSYPTGEFLNCGLCEKCLRTLAGLRIFGAKRKAPAGFARPLDLARLRALDGSDMVCGFYLRDNLDAARRAGDTELVQALEDALRVGAGMRLKRRIVRALRDADQRMLNGRVRMWAVNHAGHDAESNAGLRANPVRWVLRQWKEGS